MVNLDDVFLPQYARLVRRLRMPGLHFLMAKILATNAGPNRIGTVMSNVAPGINFLSLVVARYSS